MNAPLNPTTLTLNQQGWEKEYYTLLQYRDAQRALKLGLEGQSSLTPTEQSRLNDAKFNYLEAERRMIDFKSDRYTAIDNDRAKVQWILDHPSEGQTALQRQQAQFWVGQYDQASLELSQWQSNDWQIIPLNTETIGNQLYNNRGIMRWNPDTFTGKLMYGYEQITDFAGGALGGVQKLIELPDTMLTDSEKYNLCKSLAGLMGGFFGGKMLTPGLGLPNATGVMDILKGSVNPTTPQQMMSDTLKMGTGWAFKVEAGTGACKVYLPKSDMFGLGLVSADAVLTGDYYAFTFTQDLVQQVIAEEAASDAAMRMMSGGGNASGPLLLASATQAYSDTYSDYAVDPAATWNGWLTGRAAAQNEVLNDLSSLGQWQPDVLSLDKYRFSGMWQSNAATTTEGSGPTTNLFTLTTDTSSTPTNTGAAGEAPISIDNATLIHTGSSLVTGFGNVNTDRSTAAVFNNILSDGYRPGDFNLGSGLYTQDYADFGSLSLDQIIRQVVTNTYSNELLATTPTDPLVLDLNGDGVKLTDYTNAPVLFDADHDGGSLEQTGWVSAQDGLVVMDVNSNGQIDDISETLSEYFGGTVGAGGTAGTQPHANGLAALKSLDSNADNQFTTLDAAWNNVQVWVDANHDGKSWIDTDNDNIKDAGETSELQTLSSLGITSIALTGTSQSGLVRDGNEVLATSTFVIGGQTREAVAANFLTNPAGHTITSVGAGSNNLIATQGGTVNGVAVAASKTYVAQNAAGETVDVATIVAGGVNNASGGTGNDSLTGDASANWLVGNGGADTFNAGAGDDVLLIDAADLQASIHAGTGNDIAQVIGDAGVTLNLAQAEVEIAQGGRGDDILIGGGRSSVFINGGAGDDIVIGGAANDALSGENGADLVNGGAGNDLIRGHRGRDQLMGGAGDDLIEGGQDDDQLSGGAGNDVLAGGQGDDTIDGGDGQDAIQMSGSYADYTLTQLNDGWRIRDTVAGRDGSDFVKNVEAVSFKDISNIDLGNLPGPMPVKDILTVDSVGTAFTRTAAARTILKSQILGNDINWQDDVLHLTAITDVQGGTAIIDGSGDVVFTPDASYTGIMGFKYQVADAANNQTEVVNSSGQGAIMKGTVEANPNLGYRDVQEILVVPAGRVANDDEWRAAA